MSLNSRIIEIDIAKGILILFVLLGHSPICEWSGACINSFHMAAFFFISGLTYNYKGNLGHFLEKKTKGILLPYLEFSVVLLVFSYLKYVFHLGGGFDILSGIESILLPVSGRPTTTVYGLWFLPCLYLIEVLISTSEWINSRCRYLGGFLGLSAITLCILLYLNTGVASILSILPIGFCFLFLGKLFRHYLHLINSNKYILLFIGSLLYMITVYINAMYFTYNIDLSSMSLGFWPIYMVSCLSGTYIILSVCFIIKSNILSLIGRDSLYYYGLHYCCIGIVAKVLGGVWCMFITLLLTAPLVYVFKILKRKVHFL